MRRMATTLLSALRKCICTYCRLSACIMPPRGISLSVVGTFVYHRIEYGSRLRYSGCATLTEANRACQSKHMTYLCHSSPTSVVPIHAVYAGRPKEGCPL